MTEQTRAGEVRTQADGRIFRITIDNAAKRNAFSPEMMNQLSDALTRYDSDDQFWVAVIGAEGEHFTAGLDMPKFFGPTANWKGVPEGNVDPFGLRRRCRKPVVTAVQGITYTIGIELMLAGDIVVAADNARFCQMESKRGIAPLGGAHFRFLSRTGWGNAMYHLMLCDEFTAARALQIGLVQEVVPFGQQVERALAIARLIAANAPLGIQVTKEAALKYIEVGEAASIAMLPAIRERVMGTEDAKEGIRSFIERRAAVFQGR
ncbi:crotonase/enoyl-CoA hydratase family protein [Reyranella sp. CPCC 100927]|uniref:crotonase/enoyl-CoA hydratase family protein n=1 Tax=Reyranella sp. CPCC 100927 TaxID=2599616 RepID=UPI0011B6CD1C|nr:crotonase/enoyl-CoA hydratase family protein [Reyranella sp. CPCC 100927]TWT13510.1 crotonase/enoyl-CoA hydratase family protein [Reyranella sp. CPCC 100927]